MAADPNRVTEIFLGATEQPEEAARVAYLERACGGDAALHERVEALLRAHDPEGSFLGTPAAVVPDPEQDANRTRADEAGASDDEPLTFLAPSAQPGSLGRLGHYEVLQVLGRGGFGIVFRALDDVLQRVVALKVLAPHIAATSPARKRFLREARSSAQVRHENVVQVYQVGEQPLPYIAMEFIPGETLQQRLDRVGPVEPAEVVRVGRQVAEGLAAAHASSLIHRDIKPANILLEGGAQRVKLTDFGLARAADDASISQSGLIAGTPMFMAPEQARGETLDQRADLFSLGSVLYHMAAGRPPFGANSTFAVLKRVAEDTPRPLREIIPETPQWLCDVIARLHAKNPDDRFQTAREVADVLADCEAQLKAHAKLKDDSGLPRGQSRRPGKRRWVVAAALLSLPALAPALTEFAGVTHLFRGRRATHDPIQPAGVPQVNATAARNGRPRDAPPPAIAPIAITPFTDADVQRIAALPAAEQVEVVRKELMRLNPGFDGTIQHRIDGDVVTEFRINTDRVTDISPIRVFNALRVLNCDGTNSNWRGIGQLADLTPLRGMNLSQLIHFQAAWTKVGDADLAFLKDCKGLRKLYLADTRVSDAGMVYLKDCKKLETLELSATNVTDTGLAVFDGFTGLRVLMLSSMNVGDKGLSHFKDCKNLRYLILNYLPLTDAGLAHFKECKELTRLAINHTKVSDLSPLRRMPLRELECDFRPERDAEILRSIKTLEKINGKPAAEFWKDVEKE
jgi:serine/threonine protein kinase